MANKSRTHSVGCRLNDKELARYRELLEESGLKSQEYMKRAITSKRFSVVKKVQQTSENDSSAELLFNLKKIGNNLNQIARVLNESRYYDYKLITQNQKDIADLIQQLKDKLGSTSADDLIMDFDDFKE